MTKFLICFLFISIHFTAQTLVIAHRGASGSAPENTLESFLKAAKLGVDYIELDVHQTKDSVLVVMHDKSVNRTTNGKGLIKNLTYDSIRKLNANVSGKFPSFKNVKVPSLALVLDSLKNYKCKVLVELKYGSDYYPGIEKRLVNLLKNYDESVFVIHSFNKAALLDSSLQKSSIPKQKLFVLKFPLASLTFDKRVQFDNFSKWNGTNVYYKFCSRRLIRKVHKMNKTVFAWTVNKPRKMKKLIRRGVDGIITNKPELLKEIIAKQKASSK